MVEFVPWGLYAAALATQLLYLQLLPDIFHRRRVGVPADLAGWMFWPAMAGLASLFAWPFFAGGWIDWDREPSVWGIMLMTLGAAVVAFAAQYAVQFVVGAKLSTLGEDEDAPELLTLMRAYSGGVTVVLAVLTVAAWWSIGEAGQDWLDGGYSYYRY